MMERERPGNKVASVEADAWKFLSRNYEDQVFSLTRFPDRRRQIVDLLSPGRTLNLGCGPTDHLNRDLIKAGHRVVATDFCEAMLREAGNMFSDPELHYRLADSRRLPFRAAIFDAVVSVNSILPATREEVSQIYGEALRVLKGGGKFVAFLTSFDSAERSIAELGVKLTIDPARLAVWDTVGWQCFHTPASIQDELSRAGFTEIELRTVELTSPEEVAELKRLYDVDTSRVPVYEYLVKATRPL